MGSSQPNILWHCTFHWMLHFVVCIVAEPPNVCCGACIAGLWPPATLTTPVKKSSIYCLRVPFWCATAWVMAVHMSSHRVMAICMGNNKLFTELSTQTQSTASVPECHANGHWEGMWMVLRWQAADSDWSVRPPPPPIRMAFDALKGHSYENDFEIITFFKMID
jgi:hypothetical protein